MSNLFLLKNSEIIDLFEIKLNDFEGYLYFHGSKNFNKDLIFQGRLYLYIPCEMSNLQYDSEGKQNRPTFSISNVNNFISNIIKDRGDLLGKQFYRKKLLAKDLDAVNFGGESKNPLGVSGFSEFISSDKFIINKKNLENKERVEFELSNILDVDGLTCPSRKVYNNSCPWQYRGYGCNYGKNLADDGPFVDTSEIVELTLESVINSYDTGDSSWIKRYLGAWFDYSGVDIISENTTYYKHFVNALPLKKYYYTASAWNNKAGDINDDPDNSDISSNISTNMYWNTSRGNPAVFANIGRVNNISGICPLLSNYEFDSNYQFLQMYLDYDYDGKDLTVFYVSEPVSAFNGVNYEGFAPRGGLFAAGMSTSSSAAGYTYIGYKPVGSKYFFYRQSKADSFQVRVAANSATGAESSLSVSNVNNPVIYSCSIPKDSYSVSNPYPINFFKNGYKISSKNPSYGGSNSHGINQLGFNQSNKTSGHIVVYEIIIFQKLLTDQQIQSINAYLGQKYGIKSNIPQGAEGENSKSSKSFFIGYEDGNLGVPVADENDKLFFDEKKSDQFTYYDSYGFKDLIYKGDYNSQTQYKKGDFVKIDPDIDFDFTKDYLTQSSELPSRFFVCISNEGSKGINPLDNTEMWKEDKCSKKLSGCVARFRSQTSKNQRIPFGGFPGTVSYDYELPS